MKRFISLMLSLVLFATMFAGLAINASAASDDWFVFGDHRYYDATSKTDYRVTLYFKEAYKIRVFVIKDHYISEMRLVVQKGNESKTIDLVQNSKTGINSPIEYLQKYYPDMCSTYQIMLKHQDAYRAFYIQKTLNPNASSYDVKKNIYDYTIRDYYQRYKNYVRKGYTGTFGDALKEMLGFVLPAPLDILDAPSAIIEETTDLYYLCVYAIKDLAGMVDITLASYYKPEQLANGTPMVRDLYNQITEG